MRRLVIFWNWQILWGGAVPSWYLWGFFTFPTFRNSFWGALPPMVGQSFLLASSSLPNIDGPASTAIWANYQVGDDSSDLPTSSNFSVSTFLLSISPGVGRASTSCNGGSASAGGSTGAACTLTHVFTFWVFPSSPLPGHNLCSYHTGSKIKSANQKPEQLCKSHMVFILNWLPHFFFQNFQYGCS